MKQFSALRFVLSFLVLTLSSQTFSQTRTTVFTETMGTPSGNTVIATYATGTSPATFDNKGTLTYSIGGQPNTTDVRNSSVSSGYTGASGGGNVFFTTTLTTGYGYSIESIDASAFTSLQLSYGYRKESATAFPGNFSVDYWDGTAWQTLANTTSALFNETATAASAWYAAKTLTLPAAAQISGLKIRFVKSTSGSIRIDDVKLTGLPNSPTLTSINPTTAIAGTTNQTVTLTGTNFIRNNSTVYYDGAAQTTTFNSSTSLSFVIASVTAGAHTVQVRTTGAAANSSSLTFTGSQPVPVITPPASSLSGTENVAFSYNIVASNSPTSYALSSGTLPPGVTVNTTTGEIAGTPTTAGSYTFDVTATNSGGTSSPATITIVISSAGKSDQTITFNALANKVYDQSTFDPGATASSNLPVTYSSSNTSVAIVTGGGLFIKLVGPGTTTITANQGGDNAYNPATPVPQSLTVTQAPLTYTGGVANNKTYDGTTATTIAGGGLSGLLSGDNVTVGSFAANFADANAGSGKAVTGAITLSGTDVSKYIFTQPNYTGTIFKANQTITFGALTTKLTSDGPFALTATATSAGPITYASSNPAVATVSNGTVTIVGAGTTTITASQAGTTNYNAAPDVNQPLVVVQAIASWDFTNQSSPATLAATSTNANLASAPILSRGANAATNGAANSFRTTGFQNDGISTTNTDYFQTSLSVANGYELSLSGISAIYNGTSTFFSSGVTHQWAYSLNGTTYTLINAPTVISGTAPLTAPIVDLSGISALQYLPAGSTVYFRYYASGNTTTGGWGFNSPSTGTNGLAFTGSVTVAPVPDVQLTQVHPAAGTIDQGAVDQIIGGIALSANLSNAVLTGATFITGATGTPYQPSDITNLKVWLSSSNTSISGAQQLGSTITTIPAVGGNISVSGLSNAIINNGTVKYLLVTASIANNAVPGRNIRLAATPFANIVFSSANKTGTDPVQAGNDLTIARLDPTIALTAAGPAAGTIAQNATNQILRSIKVDVTTTAATLSGVTMTTAGTYQTSDFVAGSFKFYVNTANNLTGATLLGAAQPVPTSGTSVAVSGLNYTMNNLTTYYILLAADVAYNANATRNISIAATPFSDIDFVSAVKSGPASPNVAAGNTLTFSTVTPALAISSLTANAATIIAPSTNNLLYGFSVAATVNSAALTTVAVTTGGTYTGIDVTGFKLFYNTANNFGTASPIKSSGVVASGSTLTFSGINQLIPISTTGYFWITVDVSSSAVAGHNIKLPAPTIANLTFNQGTKSGTLAAGNTMTFSPAPMVTDIIVPQYTQGTGGTNPNRTAFYYRVKISNLLPSATYRYYNLLDSVNYSTTSLGAGTIIFPSATAYTNSSSGSLGTAGQFSQFTTDASGTYTGWFGNEPSTNVRFSPGKLLVPRIYLNDGAGGTSIVAKIQTTATVKVLNYGSPVDSATVIKGSSAGTAKNIVLLYDNTNGTGRPLTATSIESDGYTPSNSAYMSGTDGVAGAWATIIPNNLSTGVRRIEQRDITTGSQVGCAAVSANGKWASGVNTANATGGTITPLVITSTDAPLNSSTNTWVGLTPYWNVPSNWGCGVPNSATSDVIISGTATNMPVLNGDFTVRNLTLAGSAMLDLDVRSLTVAGTISGTGTIKGSDYSSLTLSGAAGTINFAPSFRKLQNLTLSTGASATLGTPLDIAPNNGTVTVNTGAILNTAGNLTLKSTAVGTASVGLTTGTVNGNVTVERYIPNVGYRAWRLLSVPVKGGETFNSGWQEGQAPMANAKPGYGTLITGPSGTGFDATTQGFSLLSYVTGNPGSWTGVTNTGLGMVTTGGWMLYIRGDRGVSPSPGTIYNTTATTLRTKGTLYTGNQGAIAVNSGGVQTLVGNIYASAIDFANLTKSNVTAFKVWDPKLAGTNKAGGYQTFSAASGYDPVPGGGSYGSTPNTRIESGQAFFVSSSTGGSVTLTEAAKTTGSRNVFRSSQLIEQFKSSLYAINTTPTTDTVLADGNSVVFDNAYCNCVDNDDVTKVSNFGENFAIFRGNVALAVEARNKVTTTDTIFYKIWNLKQQAYRFKFVPRNLDTTGLTAVLEDKFLNTTTPLSVKDTTDLTFNVTSTTGSQAQDRFRVIFRRSGTLPVMFTGINANEQDKKAVIDWTVANESAIKNYEVEHSTDGRSFSKVGSTKAEGKNAYSLVHNSPVQGDNYYRVKSLSFGGEAKYTAIAKLTIGKVTKSFTISPNPVTGNRINLQMSNQASGTYTARLTGLKGQTLFTTSFEHNGGSGTKVIDLPSDIAVGLYQLEIVSDGSRSVLSVVINNQ